ncbi:MAG: ribosome maturation factor RimP [Calditrichaeota bacterium]|nr:ribosome maturation factor RimP [Calditrichota bacterium]
MTSKEDIRALVEQALAGEEVDLVDVELKGRPGRQVLRVFVDVDGGITLARCAELSQKISDLLDRKDPIPTSYTLEVSSPGLDRPLRSERDFQRNLERTLKVDYQEGERSRTVVGVLKQVSSGNIVLDCKGELRTLELKDVRLAKVQPRW